MEFGRPHNLHNQISCFRAGDFIFVAALSSLATCCQVSIIRGKTSGEIWKDHRFEKAIVCKPSLRARMPSEQRMRLN